LQEIYFCWNIPEENYTFRPFHQKISTANQRGQKPMVYAVMQCCRTSFGFDRWKLEGFDSRYVSPPLRAEIDRKALLKGIEDGTIDMITSDHNPIDIEHKKWNLMVLKWNNWYESFWCFDDRFTIRNCNR
jgi:hypothetical protein